MLFRRTGLLCAALLLAAVSSGTRASAQQASPGAAGHAKSSEEIERIIRDYLLKNPEIVIEAIEAYKKKAEEADRVAVARVLKDQRETIRNDPSSPVGGNPKGDVTVVEFFDYRCGVCKRVHDTVAELVRTDGKIRHVYKEWPILGPQSVAAARAALAARNQGKYILFHDALMQHRGRMGTDEIFGIAKRVGLDPDRLRKDMGSPEIDTILRRNYELAEALKINGTPSFVIGDELIPGAMDLNGLRSVVRKARKKG